VKHFAQFVEISSDQIQKGQAIKILGLLIGCLHDLVVALAKCFHSQFMPTLGLVQLLCWLQGSIDVSTLQCQVKLCKLSEVIEWMNWYSEWVKWVSEVSEWSEWVKWVSEVSEMIDILGWQDHEQSEGRLQESLSFGGKRW
jgi:hypothetical protein